MKRRDVLTTVGVIVSAGCLGGDGGGSTDATRTAGDAPTMGTETDAGRVEPTTTDTGAGTPRTVGTPGTATAPEPTTTEPAPTVTEPTTATETATNATPNAPIPIPDAPTDARKGGDLLKDRAHVTFENGGSRVVVTGTITGKNGCRTAVLDSTRRTDAGLVVTIATRRDAATDAACSMAVVGIEYRFAVGVERPPASVTVVHRGATGKRTITTANRD